MISTRNHVSLPNALRLRELLRSMAMLDAILCPNWDSRYYSFDACWNRDEELGSMRDGQGDEFIAFFNAHGCFLKGFVHDCPASAGVIDCQEYYRGLPGQFSSCLVEPAFTTDEVTFCLWRSYTDTSWQHNAIELPSGDDADGSEYLLSRLDGNPETYWVWAEEYYERDVPLHAVKALFESQRLTEELVAALNPDLRIKDLKKDIRQIKYPL